MTRPWCRSGAVVLAACAHLASSALGQTATAPAPRVAIVDRPADAALALLDAAGPLPFPVAVRIEAPSPSAPEIRWADLERRLAPVWLALPSPQTPDDLDAWRAALRALVGDRGNGIAVLEIEIDQQPAAVARFAVQAAALEVGVAHRGIRIAVGGSAMRDLTRRSEIYTAEVAPYVDLLAIEADGTDGVAAWLRVIDPQAKLAIVPGVTPATGGERFLEGTLADIGTAAEIRAWRPTDLTPATLRAFAPLANILVHTITIVDDAASRLTAMRGGTDVLALMPHVLLFDADTFATYLAYWGDIAAESTMVELSVPGGGVPRLYDLSANTQTRITGAVVDQASGRTRLPLPTTGHPMVVALNDGVTLFAARSEASAERLLSVAEIVARHQRQQRAQEAIVQHYVAHARMEQHFRPTMADPGYDVVAENSFFWARDGIEWQEQSFSVNGSKWGSDRPPFPLLQPEKVLALPLIHRFDDGYRYRLAGTERVGEVDCYVVKFEPVRTDSSLYGGTVWIDRRTFARIRVRAVNSGLLAPVISNDETQEYAPVVTIDGQPVFLLTKLVAQQLLLLAGRNLLVEKRVTLSDFRVNGPGFETDRAAARASDAVMFRETDQGLRYYLKQDGQRVISDQPTRDVKALAMGVTLDPSYGFPLPIFGINYLNFHFGNPDTQLAVLFAGVLAAGNIQRAHIGSAKVDASFDFFAIAAPSSDRLYGPQGEDPTVRVLTWPLSTGFNLGWQATPFQKATLQYQFRFDGYVRDRTTSEAFVVPSSTVTNGIGGAWEYRRNGYSLVTNAAWYRRAVWKPWGDGSASPPGYRKYTAALSRDFYLSPFQKLHFNGAWLGSSGVDRFGQYQFGMFDDTRIHGVPASAVRFGEVALARSAYSINIFEQYRMDLFLEHAWGRDIAGRGPWQGIPAIGLAINVRAPWDTILRVDVGKSALPARYRGLGSATAQVMFLKPLR